MTNSVQAAREALGIRLRDIRRDAGMNGRQLADLSGWHFTKVSKIEHGTTTPSELDLEQWTFHCHAQAQLPDLIATVRGIEKMYVELRRLMRLGSAKYQQRFLENEAASRRHRVFATYLVPGVLQTRAYATVRLAEFAEMTETPADVEETVNVRMRRGELIRSGDRMFHVVMCENVLRAAMAPVDVMLEQLHHLLAVARLSRLHLGVVPADTRIYMPLCEFWIMDDRVAETETFSAAIRMEQPSEIAMYARVFDHYANRAVYGQAALTTIRSAIEHFEQSEATS